MTTVTPSNISIDGAKESTPLAPEFRVYIEGVQVPFSNITISSVYGSLPTAQIILPYMPYLQEIARNYRPKVHIFYTDDTATRSNYEQGKDQGKDAKTAKDFSLRVLFIGEIVSSNYSKSKSPFSSSSNISFNCEHKNSAVDQMAMRTAAYSLQEGTADAAVAQAEANAPVVLSNPAFLATQVVQGVDTKQKFDLSSPAFVDKDPSGIPTYLFDKYAANYKGMPGLILRLWNIICLDSKNHAHQNDIMQRIYIRLFANLGFFDGIAGHPIVEEFLENSRATISNSMLEKQGDAGKITGSNPGTALSPLKASFKSFDAFAANIQISSLYGIMNQLPKSVGFLDFLKKVMAEFFYEIITLSSPVQRFDPSRRDELNKAKDIFEKLEIREGDSIAPTETIIKPVMPIYFSPKCNVLYPRMYSSITVNDAYSAAPSRVDVLVRQIVDKQMPVVFNFRSPPSLRQALLDRNFSGKNDKTSLIDTYSIIGNTPAIHEMGRGVFPRAIYAPGWMSIISSKADGEEEQAGFKELITQYSDYEYSIAISGTRTGAVEGIFNPYIIPGYPMDIIDPGMYRPSYHAFCTSVTTNISASGATSTNIGFTNAISYDELYTIDTPMALPWINEALGMNSNVKDGVSYSKLTSLTDSDTAIRDAANRYYYDVLGVGAAFPDSLSQYKYWEKGVKPPTLLRQDLAEILQVTNTPEESITLCRRPIQTKPNVTAVYGMGFIDTDTAAFTPPRSGLKSDVAFTPTGSEGNSADIYFTTTRNGKLSSGFNAFLDYKNFKVDPATSPPSQTPTTSTTANEKPQASTGNNPSLINSYTYFAVKNVWVAPFESFKAKYPTVATVIDAAEANLRSQFPDYPHNAYKQLIFKESTYNPLARANAGSSFAVGLGQLVESFYLKKYPAAFERNTNGFIQNARACAAILAIVKNSNRSFTWNDVIVAYNQGEGTVRKAKGAGNGNADYSKCRASSDGLTGLDYFTGIFDTKTPRA